MTIQEIQKHLELGDCYELREDFFGGFVVGALIGYGGPEYFEKAITPNNSE